MLHLKEELQDIKWNIVGLDLVHALHYIDEETTTMGVQI